MRTSALFGAKTSDFFEILSQCEHFSDKGVHLSRVCADVVYRLFKIFVVY